VLLEPLRKRTSASCGVCLCVCVCVCFFLPVCAVFRTGVCRFGRWDGYRRKALRCEVVRPRVESSWHTLLWGRESPVQMCKGHCLPPLSFHSHPQNLSCHLLLLFLLLLFHRKWHLLSILDPVAQIYVDVSNENSTTSPNICRTAVRPFLSFFYTSLFPTFSFSTLSSSFILFFFIDLFFQSPSLGRCGFHTWCEMLFLQRLLTHVCEVFSLGGIW